MRPAAEDATASEWWPSSPKEGFSHAPSRSPSSNCSTRATSSCLACPIIAEPRRTEKSALSAAPNATRPRSWPCESSTRARTRRAAGVVDGTIVLEPDGDVESDRPTCPPANGRGRMKTSMGRWFADGRRERRRFAHLEPLELLVVRRRAEVASFRRPEANEWGTLVSIHGGGFAVAVGSPWRAGSRGRRATRIRLDQGLSQERVRAARRRRRAPRHATSGYS